MIIDFHTHAFPETVAGKAIGKLSAASRVNPFTDGTAGGLSAAAKAAGVDLCVVLPVATSPRQAAHINDFAALLCERTDETGLLSFGGIHPDCPDWREQLGRIAALGLKGIKLHPVYQGVDLDDPRYIRILERAGELGLIVVTHMGQDIGLPGQHRSTPRMAANALKQAGPVKLVLAHMGGWQAWAQAEELLADTGVYLDTAFSTGVVPLLPCSDSPAQELRLLGQEGFLRMVRAFGAERILFGTDSPWSGQREVLTWLRALPLAKAQRDAILGGNAQKLLGLE